MPPGMVEVGMVAVGAAHFQIATIPYRPEGPSARHGVWKPVKGTPMARHIAILLIASAQVAIALPAAADIRINEVMASNGHTIADEDGDYGDWIEFYNRSDAPVALGGFGLSDDGDAPFAWVFPEVDLGPGAYLLVFASNKDRRDARGELHTNFAIAADGETVRLTSPEGVLVDEFAGRPMPRDVSVGRKPEGAGGWFYFEQATPGAANTTPASEALLSPPRFSHAPGFFAAPIELALSAAHAGATIHYTLDGTAPTQDSPRYTGPIAIASRRGDPNVLSRIRSGPPGDWSEWREPAGEVFKATVIRAAAFREGAVASAPSTGTYFVDEHIDTRYHVPVLSLATDPDNLFSEDDGIYVPGDRYEGKWYTGNYFQRGAEWERPAHFAYFGEGGVQRLSQDVGVRIHGGATRRFSPKGLRLYARDGYGKDSFDYPVFNGYDTAEFDRLLLRTSGNDFSTSLFRDGMMQRLVAGLGLEQQAYEPGILFINGEYWGIHNIRERIDEHHLHGRYGIDPERIDILSNYRAVAAGDRRHFDEMIRYLESNGAALPEHYAFLQTLVDTDNFVDYTAAQIYFANTDWPEGNNDCWRHRTTVYRPDLGPGLDGRWRWILYDTDYGFGFGNGSAYNHPSLHGATDSSAGLPTFLLRSLLKNEAFRNVFINRQADFLNTIFRPDVVTATIVAMRDTLEPLMAEHIARWGYPRSMDAWKAHIRDVMVDFAEKRPAYLRQHYVEYFGLPGVAEIRLHMPRNYSGSIRVNSIVVDAEAPGVFHTSRLFPWRGIYFQGVPVEIEALPAPGLTFSRWEGLPPGTPNPATVVLTGDLAIRAHFEGTPLDGGGYPGCAGTAHSIADGVRRYLGDVFLLGLMGLLMLAWHPAARPGRP